MGPHGEQSNVPTRSKLSNIPSTHLKGVLKYAHSTKMLKRLRHQRNITKEVITGGGGWMMRQKEKRKEKKTKIKSMCLKVLGQVRP